MLEARGLTRRFGERWALQGVDLALHAGQVVALLGPNGAGKTTLIRLLAGLLAPTAGEVRVDGKRLGRRPRNTLRRVGLVSGAAGFYPQLSGMENLVFFGRLHGLGDGAVRLRASQWLETLGLTGAATVRVGHYSQGMTQRLAIARALLHEPELLLLDEPVSSVDPRMAEALRALLRAQADERNALVLISTHLLRDAELVCDRAVFLRQRLLADLDLRHERARQRVRVRGTAGSYLAATRSVATVTDAQAEGDELSFGASDPEAAIAAVVRALVQAGADVLEVRPGGTSLQQAYDRVFLDAEEPAAGSAGAADPRGPAGLGRANYA